MKILLPAVFLTVMWGDGSYAQFNPLVSSTEVNNILLGISADSLKADLVAFAGFKNRNTFSVTVLNTKGIGAARRWVYNKFVQYSASNDNRLKPGYLLFDYDPSSYGCSYTTPITRHADVIAVLPGSPSQSLRRVYPHHHHLGNRPLCRTHLAPDYNPRRPHSQLYAGAIEKRPQPGAVQSWLRNSRRLHLLPDNRRPARAEHRMGRPFTFTMVYVKINAQTEFVASPLYKFWIWPGICIIIYI